MNKQFLIWVTCIITACLSPLRLTAWEIYNSSPKQFGPGIVAIDTLSSDYIGLDYHFRINIPSNCNEAAWGVILTYEDNTHTRITLSRTGISKAEYDYGIPVELTIVNYSNDNKVRNSELIRISENVVPNSDSWSLTLRKLPADHHLILSVGQRDALFSKQINADNLRMVTTNLESPLMLERLSSFVTESDSRKPSAVFDIDELNARLAASTDPAEGYWIYLDRDTDFRKINLGGTYQLATVQNTDGTIEIIYIAGAKTNSASWESFSLKGRLIPTPFSDHYDLIWYDALGQKIDQETSADIIEGTILRLNFPLQGGTVRFRKDITPRLSPVI